MKRHEEAISAWEEALKGPAPEGESKVLGEKCARLKKALAEAKELRAKLQDAKDAAPYNRLAEVYLTELRDPESRDKILEEGRRKRLLLEEAEQK